MTALPVLTFGIHKGKTLDQVPDGYVLWLADPKRGEQQPGGKRYRPLPADLVAAARAMVDGIAAKKAREEFADLVMGGGETGFADPIFIVECEGDCHSKSGSYAIHHQWFKSLDETLAYLATEFPIEDSEDLGGDVHTSRQSPDPEDDRILVWEVLPTGHRRPVWGFFGWHFSADKFACGQGTLPGDEDSLFSLAMRDY